MTDSRPLHPVRVVVGVDTHRDEHVAVAVDQPGARLGEYQLPTTSNGYNPHFPDQPHRCVVIR